MIRTKGPSTIASVKMDLKNGAGKLSRELVHLRKSEKNMRDWQSKAHDDKARTFMGFTSHSFGYS